MKNIQFEDPSEMSSARRGGGRERDQQGRGLVLSFSIQRGLFKKTDYQGQRNQKRIHAKPSQKRDETRQAKTGEITRQNEQKKRRQYKASNVSPSSSRALSFSTKLKEKTA
jgi:hypothetical protein